MSIGYFDVSLRKTPALSQQIMIITIIIIYLIKGIDSYMHFANAFLHCSQRILRKEETHQCQCVPTVTILILYRCIKKKLTTHRRGWDYSILIASQILFQSPLIIIADLLSDLALVNQTINICKLVAIIRNVIITSCIVYTWHGWMYRNVSRSHNMQAKHLRMR